MGQPALQVANRHFCLIYKLIQKRSRGHFGADRSARRRRLRSLLRRSRLLGALSTNHRLAQQIGWPAGEAAVDRPFELRPNKLFEFLTASLLFSDIYVFCE